MDAPIIADGAKGTSYMLQGVEIGGFVIPVQVLTVSKLAPCNVFTFIMFNHDGDVLPFDFNCN